MLPHSDHNTWLRLSLVVLLLFSFIGCATLQEEDDDKKSAAKLYRQGKQALDAGDYLSAIEHFEKLEVRYPFGSHAQQGQLDIGYAHYRNDDGESSIAAANRFIKLYPRHTHVDYAYYLRGLAKFKQQPGVLDRFFKLDPAERDPRAARESFQYFSELVEQYPNSNYVNDALQRMIFLKIYLARHDVYVAKYYMKREAYVAALNRAKNILEYYPRTPSVTDALAIMVMAYKKLGMHDLSNDTFKVLQLNFPDHDLVIENSLQVSTK